LCDIITDVANERLAPIEINDKKMIALLTNPEKLPDSVSKQEEA